MSGLPARARQHQPAPATDTVRVVLRQPASERLERYRTDPDYRYAATPQTESWWDRVKAWLARRILDYLAMVWDHPVGRWAIYLVLAAVVIGALLSLAKLDKSGMTRSSGAPVPGSGYRELESLESADFDRWIQEAIQRGDYRLAVRYSYLNVLQTLSARNYLKWVNGKTNQEYERELADRGHPELDRAFAELVYYYEYVWYGDFPVDGGLFQSVQEKASVATRLTMEAPA